MSECRPLELGEVIARVRDERDALKANLDDLTEEHRRDLDKLSEVRIERNKAQEDRDAGYKIACDNANERDAIKAKLAVARAALENIALWNDDPGNPSGARLARETLAKIDAPVAKPSPVVIES